MQSGFLLWLHSCLQCQAGTLCKSCQKQADTGNHFIARIAPCKDLEEAQTCCCGDCRFAGLAPRPALTSSSCAHAGRAGDGDGVAGPHGAGLDGRAVGHRGSPAARAPGHPVPAAGAGPGPDPLRAGSIDTLCPSRLTNKFWDSCSVATVSSVPCWRVTLCRQQDWTQKTGFALD